LNFRWVSAGHLFRIVENLDQLIVAPGLPGDLFQYAMVPSALVKNFSVPRPYRRRSGSA
jgi:hypothetical protein